MFYTRVNSEALSSGDTKGGRQPADRMAGQGMVPKGRGDHSGDVTSVLLLVIATFIASCFPVV